MKNYRILVALLLMFAGISESHAIPARKGWITVKQSDGSLIKIQIHGDEFYHYTESEDGYTLTGGNGGDYYYAVLDSKGNLASSGVRARSGNNFSQKKRRALGRDFRKGIRPVDRSSQKREAAYSFSAASRNRAGSNTTAAPGLLSGTLTPSKGKQKSLVLLVEYPDLPFTIGSRERFSAMLNDRNYTAGGATGSAWQYYYENSLGQFDPEFVVMGPYKLNHPRSYYKENNEEHAPEMMIEACRKADADGVDFTQYANNGEGCGVFLFYAGGNEADGSDNNGVWPHSYTVPGGIKIDGVKMGLYACTSELKTEGNAYSGYKTSFASIGTFCHEFGHMLGWPDFYDVDYEANGRAEGLSTYSLMASGAYNNEGNTPPALGILERWMMGWSQPDTLPDTGEFNLKPVQLGNGAKIETPETNDYFLLEYRGTGKTVWDDPRYLGYSGMTSEKGLMMYHIDYTNPMLWRTNRVNFDADHERAKIMCSRPGAFSTDYPRRTFFPGSEKVTLLTPESYAGFKSWNGKSAMQAISSIEVTPDAIELMMGGFFELNTTPYQYDALLKWVDYSSKKWTVRWKPSEAEAWTGEQEVNTTACSLPDLTQETPYIVSVTNDKGDELSKTFITGKQSTYYPSMKIVRQEEKSASGPMLFTLTDCGKVQSIKWKVDGKEASNYGNLPAGEHKIQAEVTHTDGTKEFIMQYITIKE